MASKCIKESDRLKNWNPLEEDYYNPEVNTYNEGPGADLDDELQPASRALKLNGGTEKKITPSLLIRNAPKVFDKNGIANLCRLFGKVTHVRYLKQNNMYFVDTATVADMTNILTSLEENEYGIKVDIARQRKRKEEILPENRENNDFNPHEEIEPKINLEERSIYVSNNNIEHFKLNAEPFISDEKRLMLKSKLNMQRLRLIENDAHELERVGLTNDIRMLALKSGYRFRNGRAIPEENEKNSQNEHDNSEFKCIVCHKPSDFTCRRCKFNYCSKPCYVKDWPKHRYICDKPEKVNKALLKVLIKKGDPHKEIQLFMSAIRTTKFAKNLIDYLEEELKRNKMEYLKIYKDEPSDPVYTKKIRKNFHKMYETAIEDELVKKNGEVKMPENNDSVFITAVNKMNVVYIRSNEHSYKLIYDRVLTALQEDAVYFDKLQQTPKAGDIVVTKIFNKYNRALVLNSTNLQKIRIQYIDYGDIDYRTMEELLKPTQYYIDLPRLAVPVRLKNIQDTYLVEDILKIFYIYSDPFELFIKYKPTDIKAGGIYEVELYDEGNCFNDFITKLSFINEPSMKETISYYNLKMINLPIGNNIELVIMDNSNLNIGFISCTTKECVLEIQRFHKDIQHYAKQCTREYYTPNTNEVCIAKFGKENEWYRGRCLETVGDGFPTIHLIDYGGIVAIDINNIRPYPGRFSFPVVTADFDVECIPVDMEIDKQKELTKVVEDILKPAMIIKCDNVKRHEDNSYTIVLKALEEVLKKKGWL